jgi:transcriptional regulator with XRE-family HTH domain
MNYFSKNLTYLRKSNELSQAEIANKLGFKTHSRLSNYENGISEPDLEILNRLSEFYKIPIDDLIKRDISEYPTDVFNTQNTVEEKESGYFKKSIPLISIDAAAGYSKGDIQHLDVNIENYVVPEFNKKADYLIRISGTSMSPKYFNGDLVACKSIPTHSFIQWGKVYVLDTIQGPLCKRLYESKKDGCVTAVSDNDLYPPIEIPIIDIRSLAIIVGVIRLE